MLIHLRPRFYTGVKTGFMVETAVLRELIIPTFGVHLSKELRTGHPYPNKRYWVGRVGGRKHVDGIFFDFDVTKHALSYFEVIAHWLVNDEYWVTNKISYFVTDNEFDAVTDDCFFFANAFYGEPFAARAKASYPAPAEIVLSEEGGADKYESGIVEHSNGIVAFRSSMMELPSVEFARLARRPWFPLPARDSAIPVTYAVTN